MDALTRDLIWVMPTEGDHFARLNAVMPSGVARFFGWKGGVFMSGHVFAAGSQPYAAGSQHHLCYSQDKCDRLARHCVLIGPIPMRSPAASEHSRRDDAMERPGQWWRYIFFCA
jgi:hypothetical protein